MSELKPCPVCGHEADIWDFGRSGFAVKCCSCDYHIFGADSEEHAIAEWNGDSE